MAVFLALSTASACAQRSQQTAPVTSPSSAATTESAVATPSTTTLRLNEVQLTETAGQRSLLFRFSRPPEGVDYFPLRNPSRLVVDVKGPIDSPTKVSTYKAADSQVTSVRVGSYQGRLRLVIDLKGVMVPQFSVDNYETLVTAFIGEKDVTKSASAKSHSQVLVASAEEERGASGVGTVAQSEKKITPPVSSASKETIPVRPPVAANGSEKSKSLAVAQALPEEKLSSMPVHTPAVKPVPAPPIVKAEPVPPPPAPPIVKAEPVPPPPTPPAQVAPVVKKPIDVAQATTVSPEKAPAPVRPRPRERVRRREDPALPPVAAEVSPFSSPAGEFRPIEYSGRKISLDFKNADIHDVFRILADVSGLNIVATDDVKARVTLRLVEIPWDQALDVTLQANGLEKTRVGNVITISTTRRLETERNARLLALNAQQKIASLETAYVKINYVKATDIVSILTQETEQQTSAGTGSGGQAQQGGGGGKNQQVAMMSPRGTVAADATTNVVIIRDVATNLASVKELISKIDVQTPQVVIESYIITTNENLNRDLGIQWGYQYAAGSRTGNPTGVNFPGSVGVGGVGGLLNSGTGGVPFMVDFPSSAAAGSGSVLDLALGSLAGTQALNVRLSALENQGKARVVARPRVVTLNNKIAEIKSRRIVRVPVVSGRTSIVTGAGGGGDSGSAFQEFDVGITLKITPQISSDGYVLLEIAAESSELTDPSIRVGGSGNAFPVIPDSLSRTTSSSVLIRANDTFVLGGIFQDSMRQTERGIPYLRDTPGIGWLFRGNLRNKNKDELMVFITPKLVAGAGTSGLPTAQQLWENRPKEAGPAEKSATIVR